ncbi:MAG: rhomboid family intramembrane serine protease [Aestuariivita sp.]|nr:rhomboid family intramembrane serine protease [Aestuariivita sp.]
MIPFRDHNPSGRTPYVTYALIALNILIFLLYQPIASDEEALWRIYATWGFIPRDISEGTGYIKLVTSMFIHGGYSHLIGNMLFLFIFGDNIEDEMGHLPFLLFYLATGIIAGLTQVLSAPNSTIPTLGASGAVAGVMGSYLLLYPKARIDIFLIIIIFFRIISIQAWVVLGLWLIFQFIGGLGVPSGSGGIAYWAHAGGFVAGLFLTIPLWLRLGAKSFWTRNDGHPPHAEATYRYVTSRIPKVRR